MKIKIIIIIIIISINILTIPNNLIKIFRGNYFLKVDSTNINIVYKLLSLNNSEKGLYKIKYAQGLGDSNLYLYYTTKTEVIKLDQNSYDIKRYIIDNGYSESTIGKICLAISLSSITIGGIYGLIIFSNLIKTQHE